MSSSILNDFKKLTPTSLMIVVVDKLMYTSEVVCLHGDDFTVLFGSASKLQSFLVFHQLVPIFQYLFANQAKVPLISDVGDAVRMEPGCIVREGVDLAKGSIVLMGAVINVGARIGEDTMIDMNAVIGAGAQIGKRVHVGAGAVIAGMLEPMCTVGVCIEDDVFIGANAVVLEGIHVGNGAIIGAGSIVTHDVEANTVVQGVPARVVKMRCEVKQSMELNQSLR